MNIGLELFLLLLYGIIFCAVIYASFNRFTPKTTADAKTALLTWRHYAASVGLALAYFLLPELFFQGSAPVLWVKTIWIPWIFTLAKILSALRKMRKSPQRKSLRIATTLHQIGGALAYAILLYEYW